MSLRGPNPLRILTGKVHIKSVPIPFWVIALVMAVVAVTAGQAVGPVLSGSVSGSLGVAVEQTVRIGPEGDPILDADGLSGNPMESRDVEFDDFSATVNDEGTSFTVAVESDVGQNGTARLPISNDSGQTANAILQLNVPGGIDVEVESQAQELLRPS